MVARIEKGPSGPKKRKDKASPADNDKAAEKTASTPEQISGDELPALPESKEATDLEVASEETEAPERQGKLILDATVAPQAIRYPTDLSLLNEARELTEKIIDHLYPHTDLKAKPRTYRKKARKAYLAIAKQKRPPAKARRKGIKQQLQYLRRNLKHIEGLLEHWPQGQPIPLPRWLLYRYWVTQHLYAQQWEMYRNRSHRCDDRIVSISQPYVRPIVWGKLDKPVEFGAKLSVSLTGEGIACVNEIRWDAFHEGKDLVSQVEAYKVRHGYYPEVVLADPAYGSRANRARYSLWGKPLGRPKKETEENRETLNKEKAQRQADYRQRIPIEGKFGQGKKGYGLGYIEAKRADTSVAWINSIFLVMNL
ncbi:transposase, partial [Thiolapillus sp.]|uniref:transposase n=1 Tax=Thiolapillus sp. TaxID=2017437 RepID=UPI003AF9C3B7